MLTIDAIDLIDGVMMCIVFAWFSTPLAIFSHLQVSHSSPTSRSQDAQILGMDKRLIVLCI